MTAQDAFARMMKHEIAPALRRLGFKGSGQRYELPWEAGWAILGFQKSTSSGAERVKFTINVTVVSGDEWARARKERPYLPERPSANTYEDVGWETRVGALIPGAGGDRWWSVSADSPTEPVAAEAVEAVKEYVLPPMRARTR